ncbi:MAG: proton-conducting transporter membrane subunit [Candidatus Melainabacteria bacterium]|nr:proton-conducting transporter membrane subunit [Candidatus Melainabacteria bacterium]
MTQEVLILSSFLIPLLGAIVCVSFQSSRYSGKIAAGSCLLTFVFLSISLFPFLSDFKSVILLPLGLRCEKLQALFLLLTSLVVTLALMQSDIYFEKELKQENTNQKHIAWFYFFSLLFLLSMMFVFVCDNLGALWISIEATSLLSAGLVYFSRSKHAVEATWKYLIICSVGIAFALLGTIFIFSSSQYGAIEGGSLYASQLKAVSESLQPLLLKLGFIFCLVGYGTKAGVFPLHSWLPDAHSEAPAPASAMLSASLLNCALYAIYRILDLTTNSACGKSCHEVCLWAGVITVIAAALFLVKQHGLKRLWAYSSIENVGLMMVAIGFGSAPIFFLQALNHSIVKVSLFCTAGNIIQIFGTKEISHINGLLRRSPLDAVLLLAGAMAVTGTPPFGTFISEWMLLSLSFERRDILVAVLILIALTIAFVAVSYHVGRTLVGGKIELLSDAVSVKNSVIPSLLILASVALCFLIRPDILGVLK